MISQRDGWSSPYRGRILRERSASGGRDEIGVCRVAFDVSGDERAQGNNGLAAGADIVQGPLRENATDALALVLRLDLGVNEDDLVRPQLVEHEADDLPILACLVPISVVVAEDCDPIGFGHKGILAPAALALLTEAVARRTPKPTRARPRPR